MGFVWTGDRLTCVLAANVEAQESSKGEGGVCLMSELALLGTQHQVQPIYFFAKRLWPHSRTYMIWARECENVPQGGTKFFPKNDDLNF